jgi:hypothetical protein
MSSWRRSIAIARVWPAAWEDDTVAGWDDDDAADYEIDTFELPVEEVAMRTEGCWRS